MISFLIPSSVAILSSARIPSYYAVLLVAFSWGKCIQTMYFRCSPVGETRSTSVTAPCREKAPLKYMIYSWGASLLETTVSSTSSSGVGVHSAINAANALPWIVDVLSNFKPKLDNSNAHSTILLVASGFQTIRCKGKRVTTMIL